MPPEINYQEFMSVRNKTLLKVIPINNSFILGIYQGGLSDYDLLIKFRQRSETSQSGWSRIRTPKHIHWTVDLLIKMSHYPEIAQDFLDFLITIWNNTSPNTNEEERNASLQIDNFIRDNIEEINRFLDLNTKGEYSINFLIILSKLLMQQEKNNNSDAYMFIQLLEKIRDGGDIFSVISKATHNGR